MQASVSRAASVDIHSKAWSVKRYGAATARYATLQLLEQEGLVWYLECWVRRERLTSWDLSHSQGSMDVAVGVVVFFAHVSHLAYIKGVVEDFISRYLPLFM